MATINGTFSCGHSGSVYYTGSAKSNQSRADRDFAELCPACQAVEDERKLAEIDASNKSAGLPTLYGSTKQLLWAYKLRDERIQSIRATFVSLRSDGIAKTASIDGAEYGFNAIINEQTTARWWIDQRILTNNEILAKCASIGRAHAQNTSSAAVAANQEATVTPDRLTKPSVSKTDDVAEVVVLDDAVAVVSPKNQLIMDTVKRCGFSWSPSAKRWSFPITATSGSKEDRAVEVANALLCAGVSIILRDPALVSRAIDGTYTPRNERWIRVTKDGSLFTVRHEHSDALYAEALRVLRARWDSTQKCLTVPVDRWQSVLDFADTLHFTLSPGAVAAADAQRQLHDSALVADPHAPAKDCPPDSLADILLQGDDIIPDLKD